MPLPTPRPTVTPLRRTTDAAREQLLALVAELASAGHHVRPVAPGKRILWPPEGTEDGEDDEEPTTAEAAEATTAAIRGGEAHGVALLLGVGSARPGQDGTPVIDLALDVAGTAGREWHAAWAAACDQAGGAGAWQAIASGWAVTTPAGDTRYVFQVVTPNRQYAKHLLDALDALEAADSSGRWAARLRTAQVVVAGGPTIDPAGAYKMKGGPAAEATITARDLHALAWALSLVSPAAGEEVATDPHTVAVRRAYAATATDERSGELLEAAGWAQVRSVGEGAMRWEHPDSGARLVLGGKSRPAGSAWVSRVGDSGLPAGWVPAWSLRRHLRGVGEVELAVELVESGEVERPLLPLAAVERPRVEVGALPTDRQQEVILGALRSARHPTLPMPLVLVQRTGGKPVALASVEHAGDAVRTWDDPDRVATAVAEPVRMTERGLRVASWPAAVVRGAAEDALASASDDRGVSAVDVVAARPVLLPGGATLATPGWHPAHSALLLRPRGDWSGYQVPEEPGLDDAQEALDWLNLEVLGDFPFASPADRARAVAYLLTCSGRDLVPSSPAWLVTATQAGTGKGLLSLVGRIIANGTPRYAKVSAYGARDEESEKKLAAELLGHPEDTHFAHVDELERGGLITSLTLSEVVTSIDGALSLRRLGRSKNVLAGGVIVTINGNNIGVGGDWARRVMPIALKWTGSCRPEERSGLRHDALDEWVAEHRPEILAACHTILARGLREKLTPPVRLGSFSKWSKVILGALSDLHISGDKDAAAKQAVGTLGEWKRENDTTMEGWASLFSWWVRAYGGDAIPFSELSLALDGKEGNLPSMREVVLPQALLRQFEAHREGPGRASAVGKVLGGVCDMPVDLEGVGRVHLEAVAPGGHRGHRYRLAADDDGAADALRRAAELAGQKSIYEEDF